MSETGENLKKCILAVDDDVIILTRISSILKSDYDLVTINSGMRALRYLELEKPDLILLDLHQPNMQPVHNIAKNIVYSGSKSNVRMTMINGRIRYRNGEFNIGESPEKIYAECSRIVRRLTGM